MLTTITFLQASASNNDGASRAMLALTRDSLQLLRERMGLDSLYRELLEKTNAQLALGWTPWATFLAALSVLFTVGAVLAAYLIWRQGKDYRDSVHDIIQNYDTQVAEARDAANVSVDEMLNTLTLRIQAKEQEIDKLMEAARDARDLQQDQLQSLIDVKEVQLQSLIEVNGVFEDFARVISAKLNPPMQAGKPPRGARALGAEPRNRRTLDAAPEPPMAPELGSTEKNLS